MVPAFPTPESQTLDNWRAAFESQVGSLTEGSVLVGHSLGAGFILALLEGSDVSVLGTFLVSGFIGRLGLDEFDTVNDSFVCRPFQWERICRRAGEVHVYNSNTDPYVPLAKGEQLAQHLGVPLTIVDNAGHINADAGYRSFPRLLSDLSSLLGSVD